MTDVISKYKPTHNSHSVSLLTDHMVFCPKYRGRVLVGEVAVYAQKVIRRICRELGVEVLRLAVNSDHVHIFFRYPPSLSVSYIAQQVKRKSSIKVRKRFPHLREWCGEHLWAPSCFHASVGQGWDVVERYISSQRNYQEVRQSGAPVEAL